MQTLILASFSNVISYIGYILIAVLILLVMITVHEFGHYTVAKLLGFKIEEFAIGFGPRLYKKTKPNGEVFSVRLFPLGGFCAMHGEDENLSDPTAFNNKKPWQRILVLIAGAVFNYVFSILVIVFMFTFLGQATYKVDAVYNDNVTPYEYSLQEGDVILKANGKTVYFSTDLLDAVNNKNKGELVNFTVIRQGETKEISVVLRKDTYAKNMEDFSPLFFALGTYTEQGDSTYYSAMSVYKLKTNIFLSIGKSFSYSIRLAGIVFRVLGELLTGVLGLNAVGGTITTITTTASLLKSGGFYELMYITSLIGVNLAVFNLLPIPALDGARVVFCLIEWITKKPVDKKIEGLIHGVGFVLLLSFAILVDLLQLF